MPLHIADDVNFNLEIDAESFLDNVSLNSSVLDYGCGYGRVSDELHSLGYTNVVGVDSSKEMIKRGERCFPHLVLKHLSCSKLPYSDSSFDAVVVCAVFTCIALQEDRCRAINELLRVLKPGGVLHLVEFCSDVSITFKSAIGITMRHSSPAELRLLTSGLAVCRETIVQTKTMGEKLATCYSLFAKK